MKSLQMIKLMFWLVALFTLHTSVAQSFDLTVLWQNPGRSAVYRVCQIGNVVYWSVDGTSVGSYANAFFG